ncbi:hypothetical protein DSM112329_02146 [Paraconexibacter sp. AEG42_29]|uniref:histidine kinase n=1 Tax=Paraconexibacter sp. AEG42_29 TaxID=2997339 RepID=A0AAU7AUC8_9ACTN
MNITVLIATAGWITSAALALDLARRRSAARLRGDRLAAVIHELRGPLQAAALILSSAQRVAGAAAGPALGALELELGRLRLAVGDLGAADGRSGRRLSRRPSGPVGADGTFGAAGTARPSGTSGTAGPAALRPVVTCDVAALVGDLAEGWRLAATTCGRELRVTRPTGPLWAGAEPLRLVQALGNLVGNALEHGAGAVDVRIEPAAGDVVRCEVRDEGRGLPAPVAALVARAPDPHRARGRGLGIVAAIAAEAGGELTSAPSAAGARLVLQVPGATAAGPPAAGAGAAAGSGAR